LQFFQTRFLEEAENFIAGLNPKAARKLIYNIDVAEQSHNPKLFKKAEMKSYSLADIKDKYIGKKGTKEREEYEFELRMDVLGRMIKTARHERNLTQEDLGKLVGVQKAQISKLESSANSATIDTILKVFKALKAEIHFKVSLQQPDSPPFYYLVLLFASTKIIYQIGKTLLEVPVRKTASKSVKKRLKKVKADMSAIIT
jgi:transcriptional regulator with XRE-family HTH domain